MIWANKYCMFTIVLRPSVPTPPEWLGCCRHCTLPPDNNAMYLHSKNIDLNKYPYCFKQISLGCCGHCTLPPDNNTMYLHSKNIDLNKYPYCFKQISTLAWTNIIYIWPIIHTLLLTNIKSMFQWTYYKTNCRKRHAT